VDDNLNYYFLEMNTRLQVEHPITERVVGVDLVKEQIKIAQGEVMTLKQEELEQFGHAIECRIYAEDPENNFMPSPGKITHITEPLGLGVRHDGYVYVGFDIPIYYDPLISKLIVWAKTRKEAIARMKRALYAYKITGIKTSIPFLARIMENEDFINGNYNTHFIEKHFDMLMAKEPCGRRCQDIALIAAFMRYTEKISAAKSVTNGQAVANEWKSFGRRKSVSHL
jgi:acetyl-CoA carboxylase biotin carboxylase subunit